ncbi:MULTISPECIES: DegT/DnrJ/EryC1/StrS family aminotransferase [unclassified Arcicella]|uniref:DegT/DnrJ/EryC1/StrS family aminotransferase n=1 Tax=unclassified Arcicella TaxID=2644986 RepID=UPI00285AB6B6|nr:MULTISPECIES: DegT/DnrJ/EryC1/StrS family aminotransferase [unclassified Arcicella]MDR6562910.1 dTDP-4-amino-4,6-dideoxygalactose transaminase [Arcicella sp. BE51]MDR6812993.1 dTDP-4-amino-4,6-dideoxygalactose transaminase [Arcicella sp. BE140]MDR6824307.1 dTDP-4-amino-4,6-dideoxygalactose transaminase [Arcicella sp. BE139]
MINVTKTYLPPIEEFQRYVEGIWQRNQLTNNGPLVQELERKLKEYLGVKHCFYVSNGTIALQIALKVLNVTKEVITTPFSYCATSHSIVWENCTPIFADISPDDFCIDPSKVEALITENTEAILATHVYGNPCEVEKLADIAKKHNIKLIYDAAHAFGVKVDGTSLFNFGDISTCSFHSTKVFHTTEGGAIFTNDDNLAYLIDSYRSFGHKSDTYYTIGINGKNSEFHAAMGLCVLPKVTEIVEARKKIFELYDQLLNWDKLVKPFVKVPIQSNHAYYPIFLESEEILLQVKAALEAENIVPRRYFYPSLSTLKFVTEQSNCPISDDFAPRALALPLYYDLAHTDVERISTIINNTIS